MDVSSILSSQASKFKSTDVAKDIPLDVDPGYLVVTDLNPVNEEIYNEELEQYLQDTARDGIQSLVASLFALPVTSSPEGPLAQLPAPTTMLPRAKPLPKPVPPTKWERFASAKGIQKTRRDKRVWDEEKQEWVNTWGRGGKNKEKEEQWITEVPANADVDYDPVKVARDERKARVTKNKGQQLANQARAAGGDSSSRKRDIEKTLATTRMSTASMGKFDKKLEGEKKLRGVKRKFEPAEASVEAEKKASLALISKLDGSASKKSRKSTDASDDVVNVRKAVRFASKGRGNVALASSRDSKRPKGKGGKGRK